MEKCKQPEKCKKIFRSLSEYIDGELGPDMKKKFERHIKNCKPCVDFIMSFEKTIDLCKKYPSKCPSEKIKKEVRSFLRKELGLP